MSVTLDILIESDDVKSVAVKVLVFEPGLLTAFGAVGIQLEISSYDSSSDDIS